MRAQSSRDAEPVGCPAVSVRAATGTGSCGCGDREAPGLTSANWSLRSRRRESLESEGLGTRSCPGVPPPDFWQFLLGTGLDRPDRDRPDRDRPCSSDWTWPSSGPSPLLAQAWGSSLCSACWSSLRLVLPGGPPFPASWGRGAGEGVHLDHGAGGAWRSHRSWSWGMGLANILTQMG